LESHSLSALQMCHLFIKKCIPNLLHLYPGTLLSELAG